MGIESLNDRFPRLVKLDAKKISVQKFGKGRHAFAVSTDSKSKTIYLESKVRTAFTSLLKIINAELSKQGKPPISEISADTVALLNKSRLLKLLPIKNAADRAQFLRWFNAIAEGKLIVKFYTFASDRVGTLTENKIAFLGGEKVRVYRPAKRDPLFVTLNKFGYNPDLKAVSTVVINPASISGLNLESTGFQRTYNQNMLQMAGYTGEFHTSMQKFYDDHSEQILTSQRQKMQSREKLIKSLSEKLSMDPKEANRIYLELLNNINRALNTYDNLNDRSLFLRALFLSFQLLMSLGKNKDFSLDGWSKAVLVAHKVVKTIKSLDTSKPALAKLLRAKFEGYYYLLEKGQKFTRKEAIKYQIVQQILVKNVKADLKAGVPVKFCFGKDYKKEFVLTVVSQTAKAYDRRAAVLLEGISSAPKILIDTHGQKELDGDKVDCTFSEIPSKSFIKGIKHVVDGLGGTVSNLGEATLTGQDVKTVADRLGPSEIKIANLSTSASLALIDEQRGSNAKRFDPVELAVLRKIVGGKKLTRVDYAQIPDICGKLTDPKAKAALLALYPKTFWGKGEAGVTAALKSAKGRRKVTYNAGRISAKEAGVLEAYGDKLLQGKEVVYTLTGNEPAVAILRRIGFSLTVHRPVPKELDRSAVVYDALTGGGGVAQTERVSVNFGGREVQQQIATLKARYAQKQFPKIQSHFKAAFAERATLRHQLKSAKGNANKITYMDRLAANQEKLQGLLDQYGGGAITWWFWNHFKSDAHKIHNTATNCLGVLEWAMPFGLQRGIADSVGHDLIKEYNEDPLAFIEKTLKLSTGKRWDTLTPQPSDSIRVQVAKMALAKLLYEVNFSVKAEVNAVAAVSRVLPGYVTLLVAAAALATDTGRVNINGDNDPFSTSSVFLNKLAQMSNNNLGDQPRVVISPFMHFLILQEYNDPTQAYVSVFSGNLKQIIAKSNKVKPSDVAKLDNFVGKLLVRVNSNGYVLAEAKKLITSGELKGLKIKDGKVVLKRAIKSPASPFELYQPEKEEDSDRKNIGQLVLDSWRLMDLFRATPKSDRPLGVALQKSLQRHYPTTHKVSFKSYEDSSFNESIPLKTSVPGLDLLEGPAPIYVVPLWISQLGAQLVHRGGKTAYHLSKSIYQTYKMMNEFRSAVEAGDLDRAEEIYYGPKLARELRAAHAAGDKAKVNKLLGEISAHKMWQKTDGAIKGSKELFGSKEQEGKTGLIFTVAGLWWGITKYMLDPRIAYRNIKLHFQKIMNGDEDIFSLATASHAASMLFWGMWGMLVTYTDYAIGKGIFRWMGGKTPGHLPVPITLKPLVWAFKPLFQVVDGKIEKVRANKAAAKQEKDLQAECERRLGVLERLAGAGEKGWHHLTNWDNSPVASRLKAVGSSALRKINRVPVLRRVVGTTGELAHRGVVSPAKKIFTLYYSGKFWGAVRTIATVGLNRPLSPFNAYEKGRYADQVRRDLGVSGRIPASVLRGFYGDYKNPLPDLNLSRQAVFTIDTDNKVRMDRRADKRFALYKGRLKRIVKLLPSRYAVTLDNGKGGEKVESLRVGRVRIVDGNAFSPVVYRGEDSEMKLEVRIGRENLFAYTSEAVVGAVEKSISEAGSFVPTRLNMDPTTNTTSGSSATDPAEEARYERAKEAEIVEVNREFDAYFRANRLDIEAIDAKRAKVSTLRGELASATKGEKKRLLKEIKGLEAEIRADAVALIERTGVNGREGNALANYKVQVRLIKGIDLSPPQLDTIISGRDGRSSQKECGGGKTVIAAGISILRVLNGEKVYVLGTHKDYALRDHAEAEIYFKQFGISTGTNKGLQGGSLGSLRRAFQADVVYTSLHDLMFVNLANRSLPLNENIPISFKRSIVGDEGDYLLVTMSRTPLIISEGAGGLEGVVEANRWGRAAAYAKSFWKTPGGMWEFGSRGVQFTEEGLEFVRTKGLNEAMRKKIIRCLEALRYIQNGQVYCDYVGKRIFIIDQELDRLMIDNRFEDGQHQALEAVCGFKIRKDTVAVQSDTSLEFLNRFDVRGGNVVFISGTMNDPTVLDFCRKLGIKIFTQTENVPRIDLTDAKSRTQGETDQQYLERRLTELDAQLSIRGRTSSPIKIIVDPSNRAQVALAQAYNGRRRSIQGQSVKLSISTIEMNETVYHKNREAKADYIAREIIALRTRSTEPIVVQLFGDSALGRMIESRLPTLAKQVTLLTHENDSVARRQRVVDTAGNPNTITLGTFNRADDIRVQQGATKVVAFLAGAGTESWSVKQAHERFARDTDNAELRPVYSLDEAAFQYDQELQSQMRRPDFNMPERQVLDAKLQVGRQIASQQGLAQAEQTLWSMNQFRDYYNWFDTVGQSFMVNGSGRVSPIQVFRRLVSEYVNFVVARSFNNPENDTYEKRRAAVEHELEVLFGKRLNINWPAEGSDAAALQRRISRGITVALFSRFDGAKFAGIAFGNTGGAFHQQFRTWFEEAREAFRSGARHAVAEMSDIYTPKGRKVDAQAMVDREVEGLFAGLRTGMGRRILEAFEREFKLFPRKLNIDLTLDVDLPEEYTPERPKAPRAPEPTPASKPAEVRPPEARKVDPKAILTKPRGRRGEVIKVGRISTTLGSGPIDAFAREMHARGVRFFDARRGVVFGSTADVDTVLRAIPENYDGTRYAVIITRGTDGTPLIHLRRMNGMIVEGQGNQYLFIDAKSRVCVRDYIAAPDGSLQIGSTHDGQNPAHIDAVAGPGAGARVWTLRNLVDGHTAPTRMVPQASSTAPTVTVRTADFNSEYEMNTHLEGLSLKEGQRVRIVGNERVSLSGVTTEDARAFRRGHQAEMAILVDSGATATMEVNGKPVPMDENGEQIKAVQKEIESKELLEAARQAKEAGKSTIQRTIKVGESELTIDIRVSDVLEAHSGREAMVRIGEAVGKANPTLDPSKAASRVLSSLIDPALNPESVPTDVPLEERMYEHTRFVEVVPGVKADKATLEKLTLDPTHEDYIAARKQLFALLDGKVPDASRVIDTLRREGLLRKIMSQGVAQETNLEALQQRAAEEVLARHRSVFGTKLLEDPQVQLEVQERALELATLERAGHLVKVELESRGISEAEFYTLCRERGIESPIDQYRLLHEQNARTINDFNLSNFKAEFPMNNLTTGQKVRYSFRRALYSSYSPVTGMGSGLVAGLLGGLLKQVAKGSQVSLGAVLKEGYQTSLHWGVFEGKKIFLSKMMKINAHTAANLVIAYDSVVHPLVHGKDADIPANLFIGAYGLVPFLYTSHKVGAHFAKTYGNKLPGRAKLLSLAAAVIVSHLTAESAQIVWQNDTWGIRTYGQIPLYAIGKPASWIFKGISPSHWVNKGLKLGFNKDMNDMGTLGMALEVGMDLTSIVAAAKLFGKTFLKRVGLKAIPVLGTAASVLESTPLQNASTETRYYDISLAQAAQGKPVVHWARSETQADVVRVSSFRAVLKNNPRFALEVALALKDVGLLKGSVAEDLVKRTGIRSLKHLYSIKDPTAIERATKAMQDLCGKVEKGAMQKVVGVFVDNSLKEKMDEKRRAFFRRVLVSGMKRFKARLRRQGHVVLEDTAWAKPEFNSATNGAFQFRYKYRPEQGREHVFDRKGFESQLVGYFTKEMQALYKAYVDTNKAYDLYQKRVATQKARVAKGCKRFLTSQKIYNARGFRAYLVSLRAEQRKARQKMAKMRKLISSLRNPKVYFDFKGADGVFTLSGERGLVKLLGENKVAVRIAGVEQTFSIEPGSMDEVQSQIVRKVVQILVKPVRRSYAKTKKYIKDISQSIKDERAVLRRIPRSSRRLSGAKFQNAYTAARWEMIQRKKNKGVAKFLDAHKQINSTWKHMKRLGMPDNPNKVLVRAYFEGRVVGARKLFYVNRLPDFNRIRSRGVNFKRFASYLRKNGQSLYWSKATEARRVRGLKRWDGAPLEVDRQYVQGRTSGLLSRDTFNALASMAYSK